MSKQCSNCEYMICSSRCPYYEEPEKVLVCPKCGNTIYVGEEYVRNDDNEFMCMSCLDYMTIKDVVNWFNGEIVTEEGENDD